MAILNIKNMPDDLYIRLKERAKRRHRSVAQEVTHILSRAVDEREAPSILELRPLDDEIPGSEVAGGYVVEERARESSLSSLRESVAALGGEIHLVALFPKGGVGPARYAGRTTRSPSDLARAILKEARKGLDDIYGSRLKGVYGYGSYARNEQDEESDLDLIVVLDEVQHYASEVDRTGELISRLSLDYGVSISRVFVTDGEWVSGDSAFLRNAREEAISA